MQSLKDKLLKAGLVTQEAAQRAEAQRAEKPAQRPVERAERVERSEPRNRDASSPIPKLPPLPGSPAAQRQQSQKQLELDRQIRAKVNETFVHVENGPHAFYFVTRKGKARRLDMSEAQAKLLEAGELAVVERPDPGGIEHALVPAKVALELKGLSEKVVRFLNLPDVKIGFDATDAAPEPDPAT